MSPYWNTVNKIPDKLNGQALEERESRLFWYEIQLNWIKKNCSDSILIRCHETEAHTTYNAILKRNIDTQFQHRVSNVL